MKNFPRVQTTRYVKPFEECKTSCDEKNLEPFRSVKAGSNSVYVMRDKNTKEELPGGFDSATAAIRYHGDR